MIQINCDCGFQMQAPENRANRTIVCPQCRKRIHIISAENLPDGAGDADFDARLVVLSGPAHVGEHILLGGVADIELGSDPSRHVPLKGPNVDPLHCRLIRLDFGPSRWRIDDNTSAAGLWVNQLKTPSHELQHGDALVIGDYDLLYRSASPPPVTHAPASSSAAAAFKCPSCEKVLPKGSRICIDCGIQIDTGRPILTYKAIDEEDLLARLYDPIWYVSWLIWFGILPIASEAFGTRKTYAIWGIAAITLLSSILFFISHAQKGGSAIDDLALWTGDPKAMPAIFEQFVPQDEEERQLKNRYRRQFELEQMAQAQRHPFQGHQLLTHTLLHADVFHLIGNLIFLIVLGIGINALIGNLALAMIYPILAIAGGLAHYLTSRDLPYHPMVGASGAVMGLAGMYLILFPVHRLVLLFWFRFGPLVWNVWPLRGFWVVLFYISFDVLYTAFGIQDQVAHWAHLGGFVAGAAIALLLLISRLIHARGGDILSILLGRHAWPLIGKPSRWKPAPATSGVE